MSLLATLQDYNLKTVCDQYEQQYGFSITQGQFLALIEQPVFVKHCEELKESNSRLYNQKGAFIICGNVIENNNIMHQLKSLDSLKPSMIMRIPYEYKAFIKDELDQKYGINEPQIYPELPSVADYIKAKYKKANFSLDGTYSLMET